MDLRTAWWEVSRQEALQHFVQCVPYAPHAQRTIAGTQPSNPHTTGVHNTARRLLLPHAYAAQNSAFCTEGRILCRWVQWCMAPLVLSQKAFSASRTLPFSHAVNAPRPPPARPHDTHSPRLYVYTLISLQGGFVVLSVAAPCERGELGQAEFNGPDPTL